MHSIVIGAGVGGLTTAALLLQAGDSVFPGQSTASVTLGALRVATSVLQCSLHTRRLTFPQPADRSSQSVAGLADR
jgi:glycine/D-amino acid oxidase-like deaminating enzyme